MPIARPGKRRLGEGVQGKEKTAKVLGRSPLASLREKKKCWFVWNLISWISKKGPDHLTHCRPRSLDLLLNDGKINAIKINAIYT